MNFNKHLFKISPLWLYKNDLIKIGHIYKANGTINLVCEYVTGPNKGKVTNSITRRELTKYNPNRNWS